jgi:hypothetical protein
MQSMMLRVGLLIKFIILIIHLWNNAKGWNFVLVKRMSNRYVVARSVFCDEATPISGGDCFATLAVTGLAGTGEQEVMLVDAPVRVWVLAETHTARTAEPIRAVLVIKKAYGKLYPV